MTDIPQVVDQFTEDAPTEMPSVGRYIPTPAGRFPMLCAEEIDFDELRLALNAGGFALTAHAEGWYLDKVHAIALVQAESANDATAGAVNDASAVPIGDDTNAPHNFPDLVDTPDGRN